MTNDYGNLELHTVLLSAMKDFDQFCQANNLRYILHGGTCLGAIRHKGFIPWDDDIDIAMPREDYNKFLKIASRFSKNKYTIHTYSSDYTMLTNVMKIEINNSGFSGVSGVKETGGAFLDVFPMSDIPNSKVGQKIQNKLAIFLNNIVYAKIGYIELSSIKSKIVFGTLSRLPRKFLGNLIEWVCVKFPHFNSRYVNIVATANYNGCTGYEWDLTPKKYFEEIDRVEFEGEHFCITKYWDEYLTNHYGDYMSPPPVEKRTNKHNMIKTKE